MAIQFTVPLTSLKLHEKIASDFIDQVGKQITIVYPPVRSKCPNCVGGYTYSGTGLQPFPNNSPCPNCNGTNFTQVEATENITVMLYIDPREFIKYGDLQVHIPDAAMQMRGKISDMVKIQRCHNCIVDLPLAGYGQVKYKKMGEPIPYGVRLQSEFLQMWQRGV